MAKENVPLVAFNRGIIDPEAMARVDIDRTRLSAAKMENWLPKTQGAMRIRPGSKHLGNTLNDTGAAWIEFIAATDDTALLELTPQKMRVWIDDELLSRPAVSTTVNISDTGWTTDSVGGGSSAQVAADLIPQMSSETTSGVKITASSNSSGNDPWEVGDNNNNTNWADIVGTADTGMPSWLNVDFGGGVDTGSPGGWSDTGLRTAVGSYSIRAHQSAWHLDNVPKIWELLGSNYDTGTYATDTGKWTLLDHRSDTGTDNTTGWAVSEKRTFTNPGGGTYRHWRLNILDKNSTEGDQAGNEVSINELEMFAASGDTGQVTFSGGVLTLNALAKGALARARKRVVLSDTGTEHSLQINVQRGPVVFRVGSTSGDDDYVRETTLATGRHNLAFTPLTNFHITVQSDADVNRVIDELTIGDTGTLELTTPWGDTGAGALDDIRFDQSADVTFVDAKGVSPYRIERRGTGRSWSVVEHRPDNGPFRATIPEAKLGVSGFSGNVTLRSDIPVFKVSHQNALFRLTHDGQSGQCNLGAKNAVTHAVEVTGINDTGANEAEAERLVTFAVTGAYAGRVTIERSFDDPEFGFHTVNPDFLADTGTSSDTGTFTATIRDEDDNLTVWYRARLVERTSGTATVTTTYPGGFTTGIVRALAYNTNQSMDAEILSRVSDTGSTDEWEEGAWSDYRGYPTSVLLHEGRLFHAGRANVWASASDDFINHDDTVEGASAPLSKTLGFGPVDDIFWMTSLQTLIMGSAGSEISLRSSALDEPVTRTNAAARAFSNVGSANVRSIKHDSEAIFVNRSKQRVYRAAIGFDTIDYEPTELSVLVPTLMEAGVVSAALQRQPDSRIHFVLADGTVALLTYEAKEEVLAWSTYTTDGSVERVMVLPGVNEDAVYYQVKRTITDTGATPNDYRFLEKWAQEKESRGDTGLSWISDCSVSYTDTGRTHVITGLGHLAGESVIVWGDDTGQSDGRDLSYDTGSPLAQKTYTVSATGTVTLDTGSGGVHHAVVGLPYTAKWETTKMAYAAEAGTALAQWKRIDQIGFVLFRTHRNGVYYGGDTGDTGSMDPLPAFIDEGAAADRDKIFRNLELFAEPFPGDHDEDARIHLHAKAPRPVTVLGAVPTVNTKEKF